MISVGDYWYAMEGDYAHQGYRGTAYAKFQPDGSIGAWTSATDRTVDRFSYGIASAGEYIYLAGGQTAPYSHTSAVEYARVNSDGSLSAWQSTSALLHASDPTNNLVAFNGYLYTVGGYGAERSVGYAKIRADGSLDPWQEASSLQVSHPYTMSFAKNGYIYVLGGQVNAYGTDIVERASINADGTLGIWEYDTSLPEVRGNAGVVTMGNDVYLLSGCAPPYGQTWYTSVVRSSILPDHTLSSWEYDESVITARPASLANTWNEYVYFTGVWGQIEMSRVVPEPSTMVLLGTCVISMFAYVWRRQRHTM